MKFGRLRFYGSSETPMLGEGKTITFMVYEFEIDGIKILMRGESNYNMKIYIDSVENEWINDLSYYGTNYEWIYPLSNTYISPSTPDPVK